MVACTGDLRERRIEYRAAMYVCGVLLDKGPRNVLGDATMGMEEQRHLAFAVSSFYGGSIEVATRSSWLKVDFSRPDTLVSSFSFG